MEPRFCAGNEYIENLGHNLVEPKKVEEPEPVLSDAVLSGYDKVEILRVVFMKYPDDSFEINLERVKTLLEVLK